MSDRPNRPVPDELAAVRDQITALQKREAELRALLLGLPPRFHERLTEESINWHVVSL